MYNSKYIQTFLSNVGIWRGTIMDYRYFSRYFSNPHNRNNVWRSIKSGDDIEKLLDELRTKHEQLSEMNLETISREDLHGAYLALAKVELGIQKARQFSSHEWSIIYIPPEKTNEYIQTYQKLRKNIERIAQQQILSY